MAKTSVNLSDRVFYTEDHYDGSSYFGLLEGKQQILVRLTPEETDQLVAFLKSRE